MKYRAEIDGLRFIAVVIVIIYHIRLNILDTNIFQGGFVGVDVFFVISGYLITRIIFNDIENKNFSFFYFIERRARRILPLLLFLIYQFNKMFIFYLITDLVKAILLQELSIFPILSIHELPILMPRSPQTILLTVFPISFSPQLTIFVILFPQTIFFTFFVVYFSL